MSIEHRLPETGCLIANYLDLGVGGIRKFIEIYSIKVKIKEDIFLSYAVSLHDMGYHGSPLLPAL